MKLKNHSREQHKRGQRTRQGIGLFRSGVAWSLYAQNIICESVTRLASGLPIMTPKDLLAGSTHSPSRHKDDAILNMPRRSQTFHWSREEYSEVRADGLLCWLQWKHLESLDRTSLVLDITCEFLISHMLKVLNCESNPLCCA